jgi:hypothetical protein
MHTYIHIWYGKSEHPDLNLLDHLRLYIHTHMHITYIHIHTSIEATYISSYKHTYTHTYTHTILRATTASAASEIHHKTHVHIHIHTYIHTHNSQGHYIHIHIHKYIHTYTHTYIQSSGPLPRALLRKYITRNICIYTHTYIHTYIQSSGPLHTYTHTYIHTYRATTASAASEIRHKTHNAAHAQQGDAVTINTGPHVTAYSQRKTAHVKHAPQHHVRVPGKYARFATVPWTPGIRSARNAGVPAGRASISCKHARAGRIQGLSVRVVRRSVVWVSGFRVCAMVMGMRIWSACRVETAVRRACI